MSFQQENLQAIADAIREKEGSTDPIMPIDFPDRIRALSTGSSLPDGGSLNQVLMKNSSEDGDVRWGNTVTTFNGRSGMVFPQEGDYTADDVGAVPTERKINNIPLTSDITISASDIGATTAQDVTNATNALFTQIMNQDYATRSDVSTVKVNLEAKIDAKITYGTSALTSGVSNLETGTIYVQYE